MKSFERLVLAYLKDITGPFLDPLQFAYRANRSVDDVANMGLHYILQHLDKPGNYARILFVDFSSAFNTIKPDLLSDKLTQLSVPTSICQWITSFLTDRQQLVRLGKLTSRTLTISTGAPQGCVLSSLLFSLCTNDCTSKVPSVKPLYFESESGVTCGQVWLPILRICALHLTHPKCTHTAVNTHREHTPGAVGSQCCGARGAVGVSVHLSRGIEGGESAVHSLPPPSIPAGPETRTCNLTSLTL